MNRTTFLAAILTTFVAGDVRSALAAAGPKSSAQDRSAAFVADGDDAFERGDYDEAITKYRAAYYGLTPEQRTSYVGSLPVRNAMRAYALLLAERQDRRVLEQQLGFLTEFLESVRNDPGGVTRVGQPVIDQLEQTRAEAEQKLAALAEVVAPPPDPEEEEGEEESDEAGVADDESPPARDLESPSPYDARDDQRSRFPFGTVGLGLAIGGGGTTAIGAGVMIGWWTIRNRALEEATAKWGPSPSPERTDYLRAQWFRARRHLIAGSVLVGVGVAAAATGTTFIVIDRRRRGEEIQLGLSPSFGPGGAGLELAGRF